MFDHDEKNVTHAFGCIYVWGGRKGEYQKLRTNNSSWSIRTNSVFGFLAVNVRKGSILEHELHHLKTSNFKEKILWLFLQVIINTYFLWTKICWFVKRLDSNFKFLLSSERGKCHVVCLRRTESKEYPSRFFLKHWYVIRKCVLCWNLRFFTKRLKTIWR